MSPLARFALPEQRLARICLGTFICILTVALPLPAIPLFVHEQLGFGTVMAGTAIGVQFLATVLTRGLAGRLADQAGGRAAMQRGMLFCALAGALYLLSALLPVAWLQLGVLLLGRLALGVGESFLVTGTLGWGIGTVGAEKSGKVMSWCGLALFAALAAGGPIGLLGYQWAGMPAIALITLLLPLLAAGVIRPLPATPALGGQRRSFISVIGRIWQPGLGLALQGVGFASIGAFVSLFFASRDWAGAGWALFCFGSAYALVRILAGHLPDRIGGIRVALVALAVEACGLLLLSGAETPAQALLGAAITGTGSSLIFPSLGLLVVQRVEPQVRATALGGFAAFQDIAYGITGPLAGLLVAHAGYPSAFLAAACSALCGLLLVLYLYVRDSA